MACDMCGKSQPSLQQLNQQYQTDKIKDICSECSKRVNDHLWTLRQLANKMTESTLKQFMENWKRKLRGGHNV